MKPWVAGLIIGLIAGSLVLLGNPANMGICVACFQRDIAGALGFHRAAPVQYFRPEIVGMVLGALVAAFLAGEFRPVSSSAPLSKFILGCFGMFGALVFLGCPWRAFLRLAGGDLNSLVGLAGLISGIIIGMQFVKRGFTLDRSIEISRGEGLVFPGLLLSGFLLFILRPSFGPGMGFFRSEAGPGSMAAPVLISLAAAMVVGFVAHRSRFCSIAAFRNLIFFKDKSVFLGVLTLISGAFLVQAIGGGDSPSLSFGFANQPVSHSNFLWNFMGLLTAGFCFTLGGGCPGRQLFKAGSGDAGSAVFVIGMFTGGALAHNFGLAAVPDKLIDGSTVVGGPSTAGMVAVVLGTIYCLYLGFSRMKAQTPD